MKVPKATSTVNLTCTFDAITHQTTSAPSLSTSTSMLKHKSIFFIPGNIFGYQGVKCFYGHKSINMETVRMKNVLSMFETPEGQTEDTSSPPEMVSGLHETINIH